LTAQYSVTFSSLNMITGVFSTLQVATSTIFINVGGQVCLIPVRVL
jgi:hypothetical protein